MDNRKYIRLTKHNKNIQGDIIGILDSDGREVVRYSYDAWGNAKTYVLTRAYEKCCKPEYTKTICKYVETDEFGNVIGIDGNRNDAMYEAMDEEAKNFFDRNLAIARVNNFRYRGYYFDSETGYYYLQSRYYDSIVGRFLNADSIDELDFESANGYNLYAYCGNNPVNMTDDDGRKPKWWQWLLNGLAVAAGVVLCATGIGVGLGATLIVTGAVGLATSAMEECGVDSKVVSIVSSVAQIAVGAALCFTPLAAVGASFLGAGIGGLAGGFVSEALGGTFELGATIGSIVGGIAGSGVHGIYKGIQSNQLAKATNFLTSQGYTAGEASKHLSNFKGIVKLKTLKVDDVVNRTWGGQYAQEIGRWVTPKGYANPVKALAIRPEWNTAQNTSKLVVTSGKTVIVGRAASQGVGYPGGGVQWFVANKLWLRVF